MTTKYYKLGSYLKYYNIIYSSFERGILYWLIRPDLYDAFSENRTQSIGPGNYNQGPKGQDDLPEMGEEAANLYNNADGRQMNMHARWWLTTKEDGLPDRIITMVSKKENTFGVPAHFIANVFER